MKIILLLLFSLFSIVTAQADSSVNLNKIQESFKELILDSDAVENFWFGDDGIDCGEPSVDVLKIDFQGVITFAIQQSASIYACSYHTVYNCKVAFKTNKNGEISLVGTVDIVDDCSN